MLVNWLFILALCCVFSYAIQKCVLLNSDDTVRNFKVLLFVDYDHIEMLFSWIKFYEEACGRNLVNVDVVCMRDKCESYLAIYGLRCSVHSFQFNDANKDIALGAVWTKRLQIVSEYLSTGELQCQINLLLLFTANLS